MKKQISKSAAYLNAEKAQGLNGVYNLLDAAQKRYAKHLVSFYGWPVRNALQQAYIFGYDAWAYDYHTRYVVKEIRPASYFGF